MDQQHRSPPDTADPQELDSGRVELRPIDRINRDGHDLIGPDGDGRGPAGSVRHDGLVRVPFRA